ncbi:MAG: hypothetical protein R2688_10610 [Fimbriimonadaceae bacterium]
MIEVNPRVSRSSALASKATGYPIARVAAKIATGKTLDEIDNAVTKTTKACFEPALDYCVVKIPRWPFDKFATGDRRLSTQMKATGEVMAIDRTFESALMKAIRGLEVKSKDLRHAGMSSLSTDELKHALTYPTDERLWALAEAIRRGWSYEEVHQHSRVDFWFLNKIGNLVKVERDLTELLESEVAETDIDKYIQRAFEIGFPSPAIRAAMGITPVMRRLLTSELAKSPAEVAEILGINESQVKTLQLVEAAIQKYSVEPVFKMVDTCAGEFESATPYFYGTFESEHDAVTIKA